MDNDSRAWTPTEVTILKKLINKRVYPKDIAEVLNRTIDSVKSKKRALGIRVPAMSPSINMSLLSILLDEEEVKEVIDEI